MLLSASKQRIVRNDPNNSSPIASEYTVNSIQHQQNCQRSIDCLVACLAKRSFCSPLKHTVPFVHCFVFVFSPIMSYRFRAALFILSIFYSFATKPNTFFSLFFFSILMCFHVHCKILVNPVLLF